MWTVPKAETKPVACSWYSGVSSGIRPQAYSRVTSIPNGERFDLIAPHPLQFVPQPSITDNQARLNESTARASANSGVSHGDQALRAISTIAMPNHINFLCMFCSLLVDVTFHKIVPEFIVYTFILRR